MARFTFFLGADPQLGEMPGLISRLIHVLNSRGSLDDDSIGLMAHLDSDNDDCAEAVCESGERIYSLICESDVMDTDEAHEALCYALFEGGSLNPDLRIIDLS